MTDLHGPAPEELKVGQLYRVVNDEEHGGFRWELVQSASENGQVVVLDLPADILYLLKVYAAVLDETVEGLIMQELEQSRDHWQDGEIIGEETARVYRDYYHKKKVAQPEDSTTSA